MGIEKENDGYFLKLSLIFTNWTPHMKLNFYFVFQHSFYKMKPFFSLVQAVHKQMYEKIVLNIAISTTLCSRLEVGFFWC